MLGKLIFCANLGVRSRVEKDAAIAADAESAGHKQYFTMITRFWRDEFVAIFDDTTSFHGCL